MIINPNMKKGFFIIIVILLLSVSLFFILKNMGSNSEIVYTGPIKLTFNSLTCGKDSTNVNIAFNKVDNSYTFDNILEVLVYAKGDTFTVDLASKDHNPSKPLILKLGEQKLEYGINDYTLINNIQDSPNFGKPQQYGSPDKLKSVYLSIHFKNGSVVDLENKNC